MPAPIVTIDGPVGSGKSTVGGLLAARRGYVCLDSGLFYRAAALAVLRAGANPADEAAVVRAVRSLDLEFRADPGGQYGTRVYHAGEDISGEVYGARVEGIVSSVSELPQVRAQLLEQQRRVIRRGGVVAMGRDLGTVVWPQAELKVYLDAALATRAARKWRQGRAAGRPSDRAEVQRLLESRDRIDSSRRHAPLKPADDAVRIDSDARTPAEIVDEIEALLHARLAPRAPPHG